MAGKLGEVFVEIIARDEKFKKALKFLESGTASAAKKISQNFGDAFSQKAVSRINAMTSAVSRQQRAIDALGRASSATGKIQGKFASAMLPSAMMAGRMAGRAAGQSAQLPAGRMAGPPTQSGGFSIGSAIGGGLAVAGVAALAGQAASMASSGFQYNAAIEQSTVSFSVLLGSQRNAIAMMDELRVFAAKTPFELPTLNQAAVSLLATKKIAQSEVLPILEKLGDAAAGSSEGFASMPRITRAISQMLTKGKIQAEEMMQLSEAGVPAWNALAGKMGKSTAEVQKLGEQGKLGTKEIMLLVEGLGDTYKGLADKQSKTFSGLRSTITDNVQKAFGDASKPLFDFTKKGMESLVKMMDSPAFGKFVGVISSGLQKAVDIATYLANNPIVQMAAKFAAVAAGVMLAAGAISLLAGKIAAIFTLAPVLAIGAEIAGIAALLTRTFEGPAGARITKMFQNIWIVIQEIGRNISENITPAMTKFGNYLSTLFGSGGNIQSGFDSFVESVVGGFKTFVDFIAIFTNDFGKTWDYLKTSAEYFVSSFTDRFLYTFNELVPFAIAGMFEGMLASGEVLVGKWKSLFSALVDFIATIFNGVIDSQKARIDGIVKAFEAIKSGRLGDAMAAVIGGEAEAQKTMSGAKAKATTDLAMAISPVLSEAGNAFKKAFTDVVKATPAFKESDKTLAIRADMDKQFAAMEEARRQTQNKRFDAIGFLAGGASKVGGMFSGVGSSFLSAMSAGGKAAMAKGPVADTIASIQQFASGIGGLFTGEAAKKKVGKSEFVGIGDMNKRIQERLDQSGDEAARKKAQATADKIREATQKTQEATENVKKFTGQAADSLSKMLGKLGLAP